LFSAVEIELVFIEEGGLLFMVARLFLMFSITALRLILLNIELDSFCATEEGGGGGRCE
jgi:hypothetical protein